MSYEGEPFDIDAEAKAAERVFNRPGRPLTYIEKHLKDNNALFLGALEATNTEMSLEGIETFRRNREAIVEVYDGIFDRLNEQREAGKPVDWGRLRVVPEGKVSAQPVKDRDTVTVYPSRKGA